MDVNADSWEDIIAGGRQGAVLFLNPGSSDQGGAVWKKIHSPEGTGSFFYPDDINGDGKTDLVNSLLHGNVSWIDLNYHDGEVVFDQTMIDPDLDNAFDVNCTQINGDEKKDAVVTLLNQPAIYRYEAPLNNDDPWIQRVISNTYSGTDIYTGDINGDSREDMVVSEAFIDKLSRFEYQWVDGEALWAEHLVDETIADPGDVSLDDLDGDGDLDVIVRGLRENQMIWYENKMSQFRVCPLEFLLGEDSLRLPAIRTVRDDYLAVLPGGRWVIESYYHHSEVMVNILRFL